MSSNESPGKYDEFIKERAKTLAKDAVSRLEVIEDLFLMIQSAKKDYQNQTKAQVTNAIVPETKA